MSNNKDKSRIEELEKVLKMALKELKELREAGMFAQVDNRVIALIEVTLEE